MSWKLQRSGTWDDYYMELITLVSNIKKIIRSREKD
jgi:hypothetical protein